MGFSVAKFGMSWHVENILLYGSLHGIGENIATIIIAVCFNALV
jgi:hypothetical protein